MSDEAEPPRRTFGFKPREFDRVNAPVPASPPASDPPRADAGAPNRPPDVRELNRLAHGSGPVLGHRAASPPPNELHAALKLNLEHDVAAGRFDVAAAPDPRRRRRIVIFWTLLFLVDSAFLGAAFMVGPDVPLIFVPTLAGAALFTSWWTWETWFLRTDL